MNKNRKEKYIESLLDAYNLKNSKKLMNALKDAIDWSYEEGHSDGDSVGYDRGYICGEDHGYSQGYEDGQSYRG
jgi:hypothetical protein